MVNQPISRLINQSVYPNQPLNQSVDYSTNQRIDQTLSRLINHPVSPNQPTNRTTNQPVCWSAIQLL